MKFKNYICKISNILVSNLHYKLSNNEHCLYIRYPNKEMSFFFFSLLYSPVDVFLITLY